MRHLYRQGGVAKQNVAAVAESHAQRLAEQHAAKAGAVDEKIARDIARLFGGEAGDIAILAQIDVLHVGQHMAHAQLRRAVFLDEGRELAVVEILRVSRHRLIFRLRERLWRDARLREIGQGSSEVQRIVISRALLKPANDALASAR